MTVARLAWQSLSNRWVTAALTVLAIAVSVMLLLGVEKLRTGARASFANTISGTDLVVGARSGNIQLLLYSVFRIGNATNNVTWRTYQDLKSRDDVDWIVPLSLGDSHRGFRVLGTTTTYFDRYKYRDKRPLEFASGKPFDDLFDAVIGADVAASLGYKLGDEIIIAHGLGTIEAIKHEDKPFRVAGVLAKTGTPVDRTIHVSLEAIEAIHINWQGGIRLPGQSVSADAVRQRDLQPKAITAALVGLKSPLSIFSFQRFANTYRGEPLSAVLPGAALYEMWQTVGTAETALQVISVMVVVTALLGLLTMILATLGERRREIAILRSVGAGPRTIVGLLVTESFALTATGVVLGTAALYGLLYVLRPMIDRTYGLYIDINPPGVPELSALALILAGGLLVGLIPAWRAYRRSLVDGMTVRS